MSKYVIGYDLNDKMTQISYYELNSVAPESIVNDSDKEKLGIPTVLSKRKGVAQWEFGTAAVNAVQNEGASMVSNMLSFAAAGAGLEIEGEAYDVTELLILFVRRSLNLLSMILSPDEVECMVITVADLEGKLVDVLDKIAGALPIDRERIIIQTYEESVFYYLLHQPAELWEYEVSVFDYSDKYLRLYEMWMNRGTTPIVSFVDRNDFTDIKMPPEMMEKEESKEKAARLDEKILRTIHDYFAGKSVGTVFLIGSGFEGGWADKTFKYLCLGRRVFQGRNLYSKGACYCGRDKINPCNLNRNYVFLGRDKLKFNLGIRMKVYGREEYLTIADAGENWYDSGAEYEFVLGDTKSIPLLLTPLDGKDPEEIELELSGIVDRPPRASRVHLAVSFESEQRMKIEAKDLGFGEFYPSTGKRWEKIIEMV